MDFWWKDRQSARTGLAHKKGARTTLVHKLAVYSPLDGQPGNPLR
jgi:hypothetical protein